MGKHTKWRMERKESLGHKLTKEHTYRKFSRVERGLILLIMLSASFFVFSFGYYQLNVVPLFGGPRHVDPFTQIWNGSVTGLTGSLTGFVAFTSGGSSITTTPTTGNTLFVSAYDAPNLCASMAISDTGSNTWTQAVCQYGGNNLVCGAIETSLSVWTTKVTSTGSITIHTTDANGETAKTVTEYSGIVSIGSHTNNVAHGVSSSSMSLTFGSNQGVYESAAITNTAICNFPTITYSNGQTERGRYTPDMAIVADILSMPAGVQSIGQSYSATSDANEVAIAFTDFVACADGYACANASADSNHLLNLFANSTFPGVILSKAPIDFSSAASKELFWFETWNNSTNYVAQPIGWYLTTNQTLPTQPGYNPLNDSSVIMANVLYPLTGGKNIYYNYQAKTAGQSLLSASGAGTNPYPTCPQTSTLFICAQANINAGGFRDFSMTMNYTGTANASGPNGASLTCNESTPAAGPNTYDFCLAAYSPSPCTGANSVACSTRVFPYLNVNAGPYYIGYWSSAGQTGNIQFGTSNTGSFDRRANMAFVWVPNPCGGTAVNCTQSTTDTPSFLGWLGHQIGNTFAAAGNFLGQTFGPALSFGGSLLGVIISGFAQAIAQTIQAYRVVLNFIGNLFGLGNLGDLLISLLVLVGLLITQGFSTLVGWFTSIGSFLGSGWLSFLAGAASLVPALLTLALLIWNFVFNSNFSVKTLLYADGLIMLYATKKKGLGGFFAWVSLNVFLFTFVFNLAWTVFDIITRPIHRTKETVDPVG